MLRKKSRGKLGTCLGIGRVTKGHNPLGPENPNISDRWQKKKDWDGRRDKEKKVKDSDVTAGGMQAVRPVLPKGTRPQETLPHKTVALMGRRYNTAMLGN